MSKPSLSVKELTLSSRLLLREKRIQRPVFFATLLFFLAFFGLFVIYFGLAFFLFSLIEPLALSPISAFLSALLSLSLSILSLSPFWEGILSFCTLAAWEKKADASAFFAFLLEKRLARFALWRSLGRILRLVLFSLFALFVSYLALFAASAKTGWHAAWLLCAAALLLSFLLFFFLYLGRDKLLWNPLLTREEEEEREKSGYLSLCHASAIRMRRHYGKVLRLFLRYLPLFILSFAFLGVPLLFVVPRYLLVRATLINAILNE